MAQQKPLQPSVSGSQGSQATSSACTTKIEPVWLSQRWKIENFSSAMKLSRPGSCLRSHVFKNSKFPDACWQLCLYPGGKRDENSGFVSLFLKMSATVPGKEVLQKAEYRFYFLDETEQARFSNVNIGEFHAKPPKGGHSWGLRNIPRQKVTSALREDGSLVILCEVELLPDVNRIRSQEDKPRAYSASRILEVPRSFVKAQESLLKEKILTDCEVFVRMSSETIPAHKAILSAHSQVFQAMFAHSDTLETTESRVVIEDFTAAAVQAFLTFIYTGSIAPGLSVATSPGVLTASSSPAFDQSSSTCAPSSHYATPALQTESDSEDIWEELLGLSEKYGLPDLKAAMEDKLAGKLDLGNVCQLLAVADLQRAETLKAGCQNLISCRKGEVFNSEAWAILKSRSPRLSTEVLEKVVRVSDHCGPPPVKKPRSFH